jgi:UDP-2,4-diacetamido-2,4,6-trideoxy-beta-L-altropyranose hydrolase
MPTAAPSVVLRCDAGPTIGVGHVMRSLALGVALREAGAVVTLLGTALPGGLHDRAHAAGIEVGVLDPSVPIGGDADADALGALGADLAVVDGYAFGPSYFRRLVTMTRHAVVDDLADGWYATALAVVNPNLPAQPDWYVRSVGPSCRLLVGAPYALIRPEVVARRASAPERVPGGRPRVLVAIGGTDVRGVAAGVAAVLAAPGDLDVAVALAQTGADPPAGARRADPDIAGELAAADVAVIGAGTTLWEACCLGTPAVALVVADNQLPSGGAAAAAGVAHVIEARADLDPGRVAGEVRRLLASPHERSAMATRGRDLVDGRGAGRVAAALLDLIGTAPR